MLDFTSVFLLSTGFDASAFLAPAALACQALRAMIFTLFSVVQSIGLLFSPGIEGFGPVWELAILSSTSMPEIK